MGEEADEPKKELNFLDLMGGADDESESDFSSALLSMPDRYHQLSFHPAGHNSFEEEDEEEIIRLVNPNKHVYND
jgi:hypothetical protein